MARFGIIAAMFREVHPLVRNMKPLRYLPDRRVRLYQDDNATIAYAGMGREPAAIACRAALASGELTSLVSIGWAGGLNVTAASGRVVEPSLVIDSLSGSRYEAGGNGGTLVTVQLIANLECGAAACAAGQQGRGQTRRAGPRGLVGRVTGVDVKPEIDNRNFVALGHQNAQPVRQPLFVEGR